MAHVRVSFLYRHEVIRDVDIEQEVIHELVTAWRESNTVLLPIYLLKLTAPVLLSEFSFAIFSKTTVLLLDLPRNARREKILSACIILYSKVKSFRRDFHIANFYKLSISFH